MRFTRSRDGVKRATVRLDYRVSAEATRLVICELLLDGERISKAAVGRHLRLQLREGGNRWLRFGHEDVPDDEVKSVEVEAGRLLKELWPHL